MDHILHYKRQEDRTPEEKVEIAIIAAPQDREYCQQVLSALEGALQFLEKKELVCVWHKGMISAGSKTAQVILERVQAAHIILVLMTHGSLK